jgi:cobalt-zinc-cadmium efflux system protein
MEHSHNHGTDRMGDGKLLAAVAVNIALTFAQVIGGTLSGSLSLIADALHNLSDAATLIIALLARKIARKPADAFKTFGYKRAEVIAALMNLTSLMLIGVYLIYEALWRFALPEKIEGWTVIIVAGVALIVDVITALLTYTMSKDSVNIKAAFVHNLSDALASLAVMIAGTLILLYEWYWVDTALTLLIATYVLWQGYTMLPQTIHLLMEGTPEHLSLEEVITAIQEIAGVEHVHHVHIWQLDEHHNALEAHIVTLNHTPEQIEAIKKNIKTMLATRFDIGHSTLEFEYSLDSDCHL